ncbi:type IV toxin-antitoxin system AbiEi family antitoxin domain-containing protein [Candidatus Palauibacter sp.]|uniref:type IV toxin-antitoxin system AbiEi family antitoxin domain-containing protein n=1 Tax=Candidatus Palauibacter sp. TaxID=3101350 RepID=UPI003C701F4F
MVEKLPIADRLSGASLGSFFRPCDAEAVGISYAQLRRLEALGLVEREGWGLYRRTGADITRHHTIAAVCARAPQAVVCLLTALEVHGIGTQKPHQVWIAIPHKARAPALRGLPVRLTRFSETALTYGVEDTEFEGVPAKITTPARTVVDCFRFRSKIGLEPALEALAEVLDEGRATPGQIRRAAEVCGALSLLVPALRMRI